jgi:hypothetical protein
VLGPAVQQWDRIAGAGLGDAHVNRARPHEAVLHTRDARKLAHAYAKPGSRRPCAGRSADVPATGRISASATAPVANA